MQTIDLHDKVAFISGAGKRIGAAIARQLHAQGMRLALHYRSSEAAARALQAELNQQRANSVILLQADLCNTAKITKMMQQTIEHYKRLDVLVNNASTFYPTPLGEINEQQWDDLVGVNLKAPLFLSQAAIPHLRTTQGCIVNITDIYADRPLKDHSVYVCAKAGLVMLTKSLARDLAPQIRVNAISPGAILWPENNPPNDIAKQRMISTIPLKRFGDPECIAQTVLFLVRDATFTTGQVLHIDGGRTLNL